MSTRMASKRRPGTSRVEAAGPAAMAKKSPATRRQRGSEVSRAASGSRSRSCHSITSRERLDDDQRPHPRVLERAPGGVAEAESADDDVEPVLARLGQPEPGEVDLGDGEQARHEELVAELDLVDVDVPRRGRAAGAG